MGLRQLILSKPGSKQTLQGAGVGEDVFSQHLAVFWEVGRHSPQPCSPAVLLPPAGKGPGSVRLGMWTFMAVVGREQF